MGKDELIKYLRIIQETETTIYSAKRQLNKIDSISINYEKPIAPAMPKLEDVDHFEDSNNIGYVIFIIVSIVIFISGIPLRNINSYLRIAGNILFIIAIIPFLIGLIGFVHNYKIKNNNKKRNAKIKNNQEKVNSYNLKKEKYVNELRIYYEKCNHVSEVKSKIKPIINDDIASL